MATGLHLKLPDMSCITDLLTTWIEMVIKSYQRSYKMTKRICSLCQKYFGDADYESKFGFTHGLCLECCKAIREVNFENKHRIVRLFFRSGYSEVPIKDVNGDYIARYQPYFIELLPHNDIMKMFNTGALF
jgi:hypothetical protein